MNVYHAFEQKARARIPPCRLMCEPRSHQRCYEVLWWGMLYGDARTTELVPAAAALEQPRVFGDNCRNVAEGVA